MKPKVGPKKRLRPPVPYKVRPFPEKRGVGAPPKAKAKPKRMRGGGAVKKMRGGGAVKKMAKGGAAVRSSCPSKSL